MLTNFRLKRIRIAFETLLDRFTPFSLVIEIVVALFAIAIVTKFASSKAFTISASSHDRVASVADRHKRTVSSTPI
jgi:hypothetical protein